MGIIPTAPRGLNWLFCLVPIRHTCLFYCNWVRQTELYNPLGWTPHPANFVHFVPYIPSQSVLCQCLYHTQRYRHTCNIQKNISKSIRIQTFDTSLRHFRTIQRPDVPSRCMYHQICGFLLRENVRQAKLRWNSHQANSSSNLARLLQSASFLS